MPRALPSFALRNSAYCAEKWTGDFPAIEEIGAEGKDQLRLRDLEVRGGDAVNLLRRRPVDLGREEVVDEVVFRAQGLGVILDQDFEMPAQWPGQERELLAGILGLLRDQAQRLVPGSGLKASVLAQQRLLQAVGVIMMLDRRLPQAAQAALGDRGFGAAFELQDAAFAHPALDAAARLAERAGGGVVDPDARHIEVAAARNRPPRSWCRTRAGFRIPPRRARRCSSPAVSAVFCDRYCSSFLLADHL